MATLIRRLVSKKKKRYIEAENNFDLDLAYITPRIIAMGYPASKFESLYRNPATEVKRFLEMKHPNAYKLWSLTAEPDRKYDYAMFHNRVEDKYQFWDHEAPPFDMLVPYCQSVDQWLQKDPKNVAVIHCKAGKGRTGVMICCYLIWSKQYASADKALQFYAEQRTLNQKGVTIPSQQRAVRYLETLLNQTPQGSYLTPFPNQKLKLRKITILPVPIGGCALGCTIYDPSFKQIHSNITNNHTKLKKHTDQDSEIVITCGNEAVLTKDVKFQFVKQQSEGKFKKFFHFWINVEFINPSTKFVIQKKDIDKAYKDKKEKKFASNFAVELEFEQSN